MSKRHICKSKFHIWYHFLDMKIPGEKSLLTLRVPSMLEITEKKNEIFLISHFSMLFSTLFKIGITRVKTAVKRIPFLFP